MYVIKMVPQEILTGIVLLADETLKGVRMCGMSGTVHVILQIAQRRIDQS